MGTGCSVRASSAGDGLPCTLWGPLSPFLGHQVWMCSPRWSSDDTVGPCRPGTTGRDTFPGVSLGAWSWRSWNHPDKNLLHGSQRTRTCVCPVATWWRPHGCCRRRQGPRGQTVRGVGWWCGVWGAASMFPGARAADGSSRQHSRWTASPFHFPLSPSLSLSVHLLPGTGPVFSAKAGTEAPLRQEAPQVRCPLGVYPPRWFPPP